jgi:ABC-type transport system involved in cytochrome bd biosynthesis fused ATPase/permease subunit
MHFSRIVSFLILFVTIPGCLKNDPQLTTWQEQQVEHIEQQAAQNTAAAKALVEADAQARQDLTALQHDLQIERAEVGRQRDALEVERKTLAAERQRAPIIAAAIQRVGFLALAVLPLLLCWLLLRAPHGDPSATELEELLILGFADEASPLAPSGGLFAALPQSVPKALDDKGRSGSEEEPKPITASGL